MGSLVDQIQLERFCNLISARTGMLIRMDERRELRDYILAKQRSSFSPSMETYCRILESNTPESRLEWKELLSIITIGESYFFRDKGQFSLLEDIILPRLIESRKKERVLKIWSAGCSTGEEAYSLAILVNKLIPAELAWKVIILGTDINEDFIKKAEKGFYGQWSFRRVESDIKGRYFTNRKDQWEISPKIRNMVIFRTMNLVKDKFQDNAMDFHHMDLILCRNLFIYFSRVAVREVLKKFTNALSEGGYLMTGHGELHNQELDCLTPLIFPESVIYRRAGEHSEIPKEVFRPAVLASENLKTINQKNNLSDFSTEKVISRESVLTTQPANQNDINNMIWDMKFLFGAGDYTKGIEKAESLLNIDPENADALYFMARSYAGRGLYDDAIRHLNQLLMKDSGQVRGYLIMGQISELQGDYEGAKDFLKKVIYLDPLSIAAHLELGAIYQKEKDTVRAEKMMTTALQLIKALPPETIIEVYDEISACELEEYVTKMLEDKKQDRKHSASV